MTCPKCNVEMLEGRLAAHGGLWIPSQPTSADKWLMKLLWSKFIVKAFRCPQCNKIELVAAEIK